MPRVGEVVPYSFLWAHESELGEDSGRKLRPCVIVVALTRSGDDAWRVAVAPISSQHYPNRDQIEMPSAVKQHLHLDTRRCWIVCDELNQFEWPGFDLGLTPTRARSYGFLPGKLLKRVHAALSQARARGRLKITKRD